MAVQVHGAGRGTGSWLEVPDATVNSLSVNFRSGLEVEVCV
jgi:hypothetical protein